MPILNPEHAYRENIRSRPRDAHFTEHHIKVGREDLSRYVLIAGSHLRGRLIAEALDDCHFISATTIALNAMHAIARDDRTMLPSGLRAMHRRRDIR